MTGTYQVVSAPEWKIMVQPGGQLVQWMHQEGQEWKMKGMAESYKIDANGVLAATVSIGSTDAQFSLTPGKTGQAPSFKLEGAPDDLPKSGDLKFEKADGGKKIRLRAGVWEGGEEGGPGE